MNHIKIAKQSLHGARTKKIDFGIEFFIKFKKKIFRKR